MMQPDQLFKNTLYDHETPLEGKASFQGVMQKRKSKRRAFFWFSLSSVLLLLVSLTAAAVFISHDADSSDIGGLSGTSANNAGYNKNEPAKTDGLSNPKNQADMAETRLVSNELSYGGNSPVRLVGKNQTEKSIIPDLSNLNVSSSNAYARKQNADYAGVGGGKKNEAVVPVFKDNIDEHQASSQLQDWVRWIAAKGIAEELVFEIDPTEGIILPDFVPYYPPHKSLFNPIFELNVTTAGNGYKYFRESQDLTVAGNHRFSQYHAVMLFDLGRGITLGGGLGYMESVGIGKALVSEWKIDTSLNAVRVTKAENISYRTNKVLLPLALRYQLGFGRSLVRISATAIPGVVTLSSGTLFSSDALQSLDAMKRHAVTFDARLGAGLYYQVAPKTAISAEPMVQYQSILGSQWKSFSRIGFGFGLGVVFKP